MNSNLHVSVALATYNGTKYLKEQLDSIRTQSVCVDEVIISDDHSTDGTLALLHEYVREYKLEDSWKIYLNPGKGVKDNFYNAIQNTCCDIVLLCDQDDIWLPDKVKEIKNVFAQNKDVKCLNTSFLYVNEKGAIIPIQQEKGKSNNNLILHPIPDNSVEKIPLSLVFNKNISPGMTMAVSREVIDLYIKHSRKQVIHDWEINCFAAAIDGLYFYNCILTKYRIHKEQTVSIGNIKKRTISNILKQKISEARGRSQIAITMIEELKNCVLKRDITQYISELQRLHSAKQKVLVDKKLFYWLVELFCYILHWLRYRNIDLRYCLIDLLASVSKGT